MSNPFFSIIVPAYNRAKLLPKAIESVSNQSYSNYEIIIVDDGSVDNTKEVVAQLNNPKVRYIYQENAERSAARNNGIKNAKGCYICFLDSDDFYLDNHLETLFNEISKRDYPVSLFFLDYKILSNNRITEPESLTLKTEFIPYVIQSPVIPIRVCVHKDIFKEFLFDVKTSVGEDTILWCNIATKYPIIHIEKKTVLYHLHDDNTVMLEKNFYLPTLVGLRKLFRQPNMKGRIPNDVKRRVISNCYFGIARYYSFKKQFFPMCTNIFKSIMYNLNWKISKQKVYMIYAYLLKLKNQSH